MKTTTQTKSIPYVLTSCDLLIDPLRRAPFFTPAHFVYARWVQVINEIIILFYFFFFVYSVALVEFDGQCERQLLRIFRYRLDLPHNDFEMVLFAGFCLFVFFLILKNGQKKSKQRVGERFYIYISVGWWNDGHMDVTESSIMEF